MGAFKDNIPLEVPRSRSTSTFQGQSHNHSVHVFIKSDFSVFDVMLSDNRV